MAPIHPSAASKRAVGRFKGADHRAGKLDKGIKVKANEHQEICCTKAKEGASARSS